MYRNESISYEFLASERALGDIDGTAKKKSIHHTRVPYK